MDDTSDVSDNDSGELYTIEDVAEGIYENESIERSQTQTDNPTAEEIYENVHLGSTVSAEVSDDGWPSSDFESYEDDTVNTSYQQNKAPAKTGKSKGVKITKSPSSSSESSMKARSKVGRRMSKQEDSDEEEGMLEVFLCMDKHPAPSLQPTPESLTPQQITRRAIVSAIIDSEGSYTSSLERIVEEYEKPLLENKPQILNKSTIKTIFYKVKDILQCHNMFRIELAECIRCWDEEEKIGHVFTASFHKTLVFDVYSAFVNNFSVAMETVRHSARHKPAFAEFLKQKTMTHADRLSLFGLMVKPVQRFPQFILFLQDLLKNTRKDHHDRLALQLALTELENLTHRLNETKRESENKLEVKTILSNLTGWPSPKSNPERHLIRQDDMTQLRFAQDGSQGDNMVTKSRRLFMMNDMLLCTNVIYRDVESGIIEKFKLKWCVPIDEVEVIDSAINSDYRVMSGSRSISVYSKKAVQADSPWKKELDDLLHDLPLVIKISQLVSHLRSPYPGLSNSSITNLIRDLQNKIEQKDELDWRTIQLGVPTKNGRALHTFQVASPSVKQDWLFNLCTAVLALDPKNNPGWGMPENETHVTTKLPLFMHPLLLDVTKHHDMKPVIQKPAKMCCAISMFLPDSKLIGRVVEHLWVCSADKYNGYISVVSLNSTLPHVVESFKIQENKVVCAELVPGYPIHLEYSQPPCFVQDTVWMATADQEIVIHPAIDNHRKEEPLFKFSVDTPVMCMRYMNHRVYMGLASGYVYIFTRTKDGEWRTSEWQVVKLDTVAVKSLLSIGKEIWCACGEKVYIVSQSPSLKVVSHKVTLNNEGAVQCMVTAGVGIILAFQNEAVVRLFHLESMEHLQDINLASAVVRILKDKYPKKRELSTIIRITTMMASKGQLWIGTNIGCVLSLPLPRLEGVPQIRGRPSVSYHAHKGPIRFLVPIQCTPVKAPEAEVYDIDYRIFRKKSDDRPTAIQIAGVTETESSDDADISIGDDLYKSENLDFLLSPSVPLGSSLMSSKSRWISTPDLRSSLVDDNAKFLYGSLLRGTDLDPESEMVSPYLTLKKSRGASIYTAMRRSIRKRSARHKQLIEAETIDAEKGHTNDALHLIDNDDEEAEDTGEGVNSIEEPSSQEQHANTNLLQIVVSGGDGYIDWNKSTDKQLAYEDICLLLWQCRI